MVGRFACGGGTKNYFPVKALGANTAVNEYKNPRGRKEKERKDLLIHPQETHFCVALDLTEARGVEWPGSRSSHETQQQLEPNLLKVKDV